MMPTTTPVSGAPFALSDHALLSITGRDAVAFVQAQTMNDVAALGDGQWHWNGWLTPKGRVIALFALLRRDAQTLWLLLPDADAEVLATALRRFVFRSKVEIAVRGDLHVSGAFAPPMRASGAVMAEDGDAIELDAGADGGPRTLRIAATACEEDAALLARWRAFDLAHGLPRLDAAQRERWTPQQLSLERLRAFSVRKGCYPGQEIVARTHFLGQAKRGLVLLHGESPLQPGAQVADDAQALGEVIAVGDSNHYVALAVMPASDDAQAWTAGGVPVRSVALGDGLAR